MIVRSEKVLAMRAAPNTSLQRTPAAALPSPLSSRALGAYRFTVPLAILALASSAAIASVSRTPIPTRTPAVVAPVLLNRVEPYLPKGRQPIPVTLSATISKEGDVRDISVMESEDHSLDRFYIDAVRKWKYKPGTLEGKPVAVYLTITVMVSHHD
jgi:TonB family protein